MGRAPVELDVGQDQPRLEPVAVAPDIGLALALLLNHLRFCLAEKARVREFAGELAEIVEYAHALTPRRRVFVAVNTLVRNDELPELTKLRAYDRQEHIQRAMEAGMSREQAERHADEDLRDRADSQA